MTATVCESIQWRATLDLEERARRLHEFLPPRRLDSDALLSRIERLERLYDVFRRTAPVPAWGSGLVVTEEMHRQVEVYLPLADIGCAFAPALRLASAPSHGGTALATEPSWYGFLDELSLPCFPANPAEALRLFCGDYDFRLRFLFALFIPRHFGGKFSRYPAQMRQALHFLRRLGRPVRCLDAACGTGEQAWELAGALRKAEIPAEVEGASVNAVEIFGAAHGFFPDNPARERRHREEMHRVLDNGAAGLLFRVEDLLASPKPPEHLYDLIFCNGFLGGPFLHDAELIRRTVQYLARRLKPGGLLMASHSFHGGWKKKVPLQMLVEALRQAGLRNIEADEGVAGEQVADEGGEDIVSRRR